MTTLQELQESKERLEGKIYLAIQQFITDTNIIPKLIVVEKEYPHSCGIQKSIYVKVIVEI